MTSCHLGKFSASPPTKICPYLYARRDWLCGCVKKYCLFCWLCLLFRSIKSSTWICEKPKWLGLINICFGPFISWLLLPDRTAQVIYSFCMISPFSLMCSSILKNTNNSTILCPKWDTYKNVVMRWPQNLSEAIYSSNDYYFWSYTEFIYAPL